NVIPNKSFLSDLKKLSKKYPSLKNDVNDLVASLKVNPKLGDPLGKDCYKIRLLIKSKGKGKSGGGRLINCVKLLRSSVYLLAIFDKADFDTLNTHDLQERLKEII
ncbi:MAG: addiction module toxin RelE, partial [Ferruginibacter sp.]